MATVHALVRGRRCVIDTDDNSDRAGAGGEAVVKIIGGEAVKIYFDYHPKRAAHLRRAPKNAPANAIMPLDLVFDANDPNRVIGYVMRLLKDVFPISMFGDKAFQKQHGLTWQKLIQILRSLHEHVVGVHEAGIILGDFNEKNVLVDPSTLEVFIVDMDNAEWGDDAGDEWETKTFTFEFTDPRMLIEASNPLDPPVLRAGARYSKETDWYALAVMVCKVLTGGTPYRDGNHKPQPGERKQRLKQRVLSRVTFFEQSVRVSEDQLIHPSRLPEGLGLILRDIFVDDRRETPFPRQFLETFAWMTCPSCKTTHGRTTCPNPKCGAAGVTTPTAPYFKPGTRPAKGHVLGQIFLAAAPHKDTVQYLRYEDGKYCREDGSIVLRKCYSPDVSALIAGTRTVLVAGQKFAIINGGRQALTQYYATQRVFGRTTVAANSRYVYWMSGAHLVRDDSLRGIASIGSAIPHKTSVWVGERFGVALMQAGTLTSVMTFNDTGYTGRYDLPPQSSAVVDAQCVIGNSQAWLTVTTESTAGTRCTMTYVFGATAQLLATAPTQQGGKTGIAQLSPAAVATGNSLMVPINGIGIVRYGIANGTIREEGRMQTVTTFDDTVGLVMSSTALVHVTREHLDTLIRF